jgi:alpha-galactosidase
VSAKLRYYAMGKALNESGRAIFFSIRNWGQEQVWTWGATIGNSWRTTGDISAKWDSFVKILDQQVGLEKYSGPGGWNDPDML